MLLPAAGGLIYLATFGAPARLIVMNAAALGLALLCVLWLRVPQAARARTGLAALAACLLFVPPLLGHNAGEVSRWLPLGPVLLHSGALVLPLVTVLAAPEPGRGTMVLALAATALALQPDAGALAGLAAASAALAGTHRSASLALVAAASLTLALATWERRNA